MYAIQMARQRTFLLAWAAGFLVYFFVIGIAYGTIQDAPTLDLLWSNLPEELRALLGGADSITSPGGYVESQATSLLPLVLGGVLAAQATRFLSGAEQAGELDLLLSLPVRRATYFWDHASVGVTQAIVWTACVVLGLTVGMASVGVGGGDLLRVAYMVVEVLPLALTVHAVALLVGASLHRRAPGVAIVGVLLAVSFLLQVVGSLSDATSWLHWLSLYSIWLRGHPYALQPNGLYIALCFSVIVVCQLLAARAWVRKDLRG